MEEWKNIAGMKGLYQISNHGRIKSFRKKPQGKVLSVKNSTGWYLGCILCVNGKRHSVRIHRLVAETFIPNPESKPEINHKDGNKQNNHINNLEWTFRKENWDHAMKTGLANFKAMNHRNKFINPKPVLQIREDGKIIGKFHNCKEAGKLTGVCARNIHQVASKTEYKPGLIRKQAGGYRWEFYGD